MDIKIKNATIRIVNDDMLKQEAEIYVCPTTPDLEMKRGVAEIIKNLGGESIQEEAKIKVLLNQERYWRPRRER